MTFRHWHEWPASKLYDHHLVKTQHLHRHRGVKASRGLCNLNVCVCVWNADHMEICWNDLEQKHKENHIKSKLFCKPRFRKRRKFYSTRIRSVMLHFGVNNTFSYAGVKIEPRPLPFTNLCVSFCVQPLAWIVHIWNPKWIVQSSTRVTPHDSCMDTCHRSWW